MSSNQDPEPRPDRQNKGWERIERWDRRRSFASAVFVGAAVGIVIGLVVALWGAL